MNLFDKILDLIALPIRKLWRVAAHGTPQEQFRVIFTFAVLMVGSSYLTTGGQIIIFGFDEPMYLAAGELVFQGEIDAYRTPVYPLICKICLILSQDYGLWLVVAVQTIMFLVSVVAMHKACCLLAKDSPLLRFIAEACYSCNSAVSLWIFHILTESLSISIVVLLSYLIILVLKGVAQFRHGIYLSVLFLTMLFLKPYFICFAPAVLIAIFLAYRKGTTSARIAFAIGVILNVGAYLTYCHQYEKKYGIFATTCVGVQNLYGQIGRLGPRVDGVQINLNKKFVGHWIAENEIPNAQQVCKKTIKEKPAEYVMAVLTELSLSGSETIPDYHSFKLPIRVWEWLILAFIIRHLWRWRKRKANVHIHAVFAIMAICGIFTAVTGSEFFNYGRLAMPVYPMLCLMIAAPGNFREDKEEKDTETADAHRHKECTEKDAH